MKEIHYTPYDIHSKVQRIQIKDLDCESLIETLEDCKSFDVNGTTFGYADLHLDLANDIFPNFDICAARIHAWSHRDKALPHFDSAFQDRDVFIIRLNDGPPRLKIEGVLVPEYKGFGYMLPSGTMHEVITGPLRHTLVAWGNING